MTDRELLMLAARAAGIDGEYHELGIYLGPLGHRAYWNPLEDDGDALRLAMTLYMRVRIQGYGRSIADCRGSGQLAERHFDDRFAATRRAIVRAAASRAK